MSTALSPRKRRQNTPTVAPGAIVAGLLQLLEDLEAEEKRPFLERVLRAGVAATGGGAASGLADLTDSPVGRAVSGGIMAPLARAAASHTDDDFARILARGAERGAWTSATIGAIETTANYIDLMRFGETRRIFFSHAWDHTIEYAWIREDLRTRRYFFDHSVPPEKAIRTRSRRIIDATMAGRIDRTSTFVVLAHPEALERPRVKAEIRSARAQGKFMIAARPEGYTHLPQPDWAHAQVSATAEDIERAIWHE